MLILERRKNESIMIGDNIKVMVTNVKNGRVFLGIEAPAGVPVHRQEVYDAIQEQKDARVIHHERGGADMQSLSENGN